MDESRCTGYMGVDGVYIVYRCGESELPVCLEEIHHAKEEGVVFKFLTTPVECSEFTLDSNTIRVIGAGQCVVTVMDACLYCKSLLKSGLLWVHTFFRSKKILFSGLIVNHRLNGRLQNFSVSIT